MQLQLIGVCELYMAQPTLEYGAIIVEVFASMRSPERYFVEETVTDCTHKKWTGRL